MGFRSSTINELRDQIARIENGYDSDSIAYTGSSDTLSSMPKWQRPTKANEELSEDAFKRILRLSSVRDRSAKEIKARLRSEDFEDSEIEAAVTKAIRCNIVNDSRFADSRIRKLVHDGTGIPGIEKELAKHDISLSQIAGWPYDYIDRGEGSELTRALAYLERRPSRSKNKLRGSYQKLIGHGYSSDIAMRASRTWAASE